MSVALTLSLVDPKHLPALLDGTPLTVARCAAVLRWPDLPMPALAGPDRPIGRLSFGGEFCETLLPSPDQLDRAVRLTEAQGLALSLATPLCSDGGIERIRRLLPRLPPGSEVVANDWGVLALLGRDHPGLVAVAGRILCKMMKDPRLPSPDWGRLYPHGIHSRAFTAVLKKLHVGRIEIDVPVFAAAEDFHSPAMAVAVHVPYSFSVKGRSCKIGSLHQPDREKFATGHDCRRECLAYAATLVREEAGAADLPTFGRGTAIFFRQSAEMATAVGQAAAAGWVERLILAGDWT